MELLPLPNSQPIYLDNAATTLIAPEVADVLSSLYAEQLANPASLHRAGRYAKSLLEDAKDKIKSLLLESSSARTLTEWQLLITSGGTEANNLALTGLSSSPSPVTAYSLGSAISPVCVSTIEHPSVLSVAQALQAGGHAAFYLPVNQLGELSLSSLEETLERLRREQSHSPLISVMLGNNETGVIQPLKEIVSIAHSSGAIVHCDAVQACGKIPLEVLALGIDAITVSAHKFHGPTGVGALLYRSHLALTPLLYGGGQQLGLRPGTESVPLTVAFATALDRSERLRCEGGYARVAELRDRFEAALLAGWNPEAGFEPVVLGAKAARLPHISSVAFPGLDRQALLMALDLAGVQCSSGSACASGSSQPSHVLEAMALPGLWVGSTLRFSFSHGTSPAEIDEAVRRVRAVVEASRARLLKPQVSSF